MTKYAKFGIIEAMMKVTNRKLYLLYQRKLCVHVVEIPIHLLPIQQCNISFYHYTLVFRSVYYYNTLCISRKLRLYMTV